MAQVQNRGGGHEVRVVVHETCFDLLPLDLLCIL
jgi:hypothetical protein